MKKKFKGYLGKQIIEHLHLRRGLGRDYRVNEIRLMKFNQIVQRKWPRAKTVTREMVMAFLRTNRHLKTICRCNDITYIRMFCMDLVAQGIPAFIPDRKLLPKCSSSTRVHLFNEREVLKLMKAAKVSTQGIVPASSFSTLIGLFWTTGLRLAEAISINIGDIDWTQKMLFVPRGKYGKSRWIPLSESTLAAVGQHLKVLRRHGIAIDEKAPLFVNKKYERIKKRTTCERLRYLYRSAGIKTAWGGYPRTMDLRHSYATYSLKGVRARGTDPASKLPALAIAMGHSSLGSTQVYLHPTMETLQVASKAFERKLLSFKGIA